MIRCLFFSMLLTCGASASDSERLLREQSVVPGTFRVDVDTEGSGVKSKDADLWWEIVNDYDRKLVPVNGACIALVTDGSEFDAIDRDYLAHLRYSDLPISDTNQARRLAPETVVAVQTTDGNYAKLRVVRYYDSKDFSFSGNELFAAKWKQFTQGRPGEGIRNYHLELERVVYRGFERKPASGGRGRMGCGDGTGLPKQPPRPPTPAGLL